MNSMTLPSEANNIRNHKPFDLKLPGCFLTRGSSRQSTDSASSKSIGNGVVKPLPEGFVPGDNEVICGRGKKCFKHIGNERFREIVAKYLNQYSDTSSKIVKSYILSTIIAEVRKNSMSGGFVKKDPDTGRWFEVGGLLAREKTSQAFRDAHQQKNGSDNQLKKKRRQQEQEEVFLDGSPKKLQKLAGADSDAAGCDEHRSFDILVSEIFTPRSQSTKEEVPSSYLADLVSSTNAGDRFLQPILEKNPFSNSCNSLPFSTFECSPESLKAGNELNLTRHACTFEQSLDIPNIQQGTCSPNSTGTYEFCANEKLDDSNSGDIFSRLCHLYGSSLSVRNDNPFEPTPIVEENHGCDVVQ